MDKQKLSLLVPDWPAPKHVLACTTLRGISNDENEYSDFNLALHVDDDEEDVIINRLHLKNTLALPAEPVWLEQVHGVDSIDLSIVENDTPRADASMSFSNGKVCCVMTADCLPLLVTDKAGRGVAAIHAGWRGLANGVIKNTIEKFVQSSSIKNEECLVWLGPAISQKHFEVGSDVYQAVNAQLGPRLRGDAGIGSAFIEQAGERDKYFCNLYQLARLELHALGVTEIYGGDQCTYEQEEKYYSYRRSSHNGQTNCGRMASLIWMSPPTRG